MVQNSHTADSDEGGWQKGEGDPSSPTTATSEGDVDGATDIVAYLNNAGQARWCKEVKDAGIRAMQHGDGLSPVYDDEKRVRELFAAIIQDENSCNITIMPSTAFAITFGARNVQRTNKKREGLFVWGRGF